MGEDQEHHLAALSPIGAGRDGIAEVAFDHAEDRLHLPALAVGFLIEVGPHRLTVFSLKRFIR